MFKLGEHVYSHISETGGIVVRDDGGAVVIRDDKTGSPVEFMDRNELERTDSVPGPSERPDPIHDYWLRHAHNAGMAVQALRIINNNARQALQADSGDAGSPHTAALRDVELFSADVLSHVFPT